MPDVSSFWILSQNFLKFLRVPADIVLRRSIVRRPDERRRLEPGGRPSVALTNNLSIRRLCWPILAALGLVGVALEGNADYLSRRGPPPLRWRPTAPPRPEVLQNLPPLSTGQENTSTRSDPVLSPALSPRSATNTAALRAAGPAAPIQTKGAPSVAGAATTANPSPWLAPEVVTNLFYQPYGTNQRPMSLMPLEFVPPMLSAPASSSATYSTEKP